MAPSRKTGVGGLFWTLWYPGDVKAAQIDLLAKAGAFDQTVQSCTTIAPAKKAAWSIFYASVKSFCQIDYGWFTTTGSTGDQIDSYRKQLFDWGANLQKSGCALQSPNTDPAPDQPWWLTAVKYGSVAAAVLGGAYIVSEVAALIPKPASQASAGAREARRLVGWKQDLARQREARRR